MIDGKGEVQARMKDNNSGKRRTYSLGPIRSLSNKLFLSIGKENTHQGVRSLHRQQSHLLLTRTQ